MSSLYLSAKIAQLASENVEAADLFEALVNASTGSEIMEALDAYDPAPQD